MPTGAGYPHHAKMQATPLSTLPAQVAPAGHRCSGRGSRHVGPAFHQGQRFREHRRGREEAAGLRRDRAGRARALAAGGGHPAARPDDRRGELVRHPLLHPDERAAARRRGRRQQRLPARARPPDRPAPARCRVLPAARIPPARGGRAHHRRAGPLRGLRTRPAQAHDAQLEHPELLAVDLEARPRARGLLRDRRLRGVRWRARASACTAR
jgi:hypothetical protein